MRKGFTLVEMLVVIAICAMLSAIGIAYTSVSRNQIALAVETAKVSQFILRAKDLAIATYNDNPQTCAFGVSFNVTNQTYSIFAYTPKNNPSEHVTAPPCPDDTLASTSPINSATEISQYSAATWNVPLASGVHMVNGGNGDDAAVVLFYPPAPTTWISRDTDPTHFLNPAGPSSVTSKVYLVTADGKASSTISINGSGQVSF